MARLDAQHRMQETEDLDIPLPFVVYKGLTKQEEIKIFTDINDKHKGLTKSLVDSHTRTLLGQTAEEKAPHLAIADKLNDDSESPWYRTVNTGGESTATPGTKRKITLRTLQTAIKEMIDGPQCESQPFDKKYECVKNFWKAVVLVFPDEWTNHRNHLLTKGIGVAALASVGQGVIERCLTAGDTSVGSMKAHVQKLAGLDWGNKTSVFKAFGGRKGASIAAKLLRMVVWSGKSVNDLDKLALEVEL